MLTLLGAYDLAKGEDERLLAGLELATVRRQWLELREQHNLRVEE